MIVVLEGPDLAGKSTLASKLESQHFGAVIVENGQPPTGVVLFDHYASQIVEASGHPNLTVFDRLHLGELIYGPRYRGSALIDDEQLLVLERLLDQSGALKVHVDAADADLLDRHAERGDDFVTSTSDLIQIAQSYRSLIGSRRVTPGWTRWSIGESLPCDLT